MDHSTTLTSTVCDAADWRRATSQRSVTRDARPRLAPLELSSSNEPGPTVEIHACRSCDEWCVEARSTDAGLVVIREWHDKDCPHLRSLLINELADDAWFADATQVRVGSVVSPCRVVVVAADSSVQ